MKKVIGLLALCALVGVFVAAKAQKDIKRAAKNAIDAFFHEGASASKAHLLATLSDKRISESSGLAVSRLYPNVLWTQNDSGGGRHIFAIDMKGRTLARFKVTDAKNEDWEDIAIGPGTDGKSAIYIGDIGDNSEARDDLAIYRVREPSLATSRTMMEAETATAEKFRIRYPDRPHNAETLMVHPKTGEIFIVTKAYSGVSGVYAYPMPLQPDHKVTLKKIATLTFTSAFGKGRLADAERLTTGGAISPDGRRMVVRTYLAAYEWLIAPNQSIADTLKGQPTKTILPLTRQGESICYRADSKAFFTTSEGVASPLYEIPLK